ncbi:MULTISPECIES: nicotinamide riboside transporter PnuC [Bacillus]|jgi:nicotinamide mononucleotide transporter|uniref:Nicotinamide mononucleotide transporter n=4 Tax=Bacillus cereus group TaxID=86661 RepID=A0A084IU80_BACMY|nr:MULTISPECIES: nicotinamide riboside transporter PnuC [Bacillus]EJR97412.1 nicotinamide mononucleotide transporter PnuC [Bacillus cereus VDM034]EJS16862.1 nicotinamide mononucleotide transporter PnuC [Bacillus cereus VDM062]MBK5515198.1 nicotinamide mononucleotide transporter [Bacillus sp. TH11]MBT2580072.1 nicotinamide mononucleotide transporter [Bacillus sp. ISL-8]ARJ19968.1 nicotinamide mononucleotide transporter PnuC [Bacillus mycoides]
MVRSPLFLLISSIICILVGFYIRSSYIEIFASVMGIINVWLLAREKVSNFLFGMITVAVFLYIFTTQGLYAMAVLAAFQFIFNVYGWYYWIARSGEEKVKPTVRLDLKGWIIYILFILVAWIGWGYYQVRYLESTSPYLDALNAVLGLVAQFMLSRKILENWHLWILYNIVSIVIYISTGLYVMLVLAIINLFLCIDGLLEWKKNHKERERVNNYI